MRSPVAIAAELQARLDAADLRFVPDTIRGALAELAEFCTSVATLVQRHGLDLVDEPIELPPIGDDTAPSESQPLA